MTKVLFISGSLRSVSNSDLLARECERGAMDAGYETEFLSLKGKVIHFCIGCLACQKTGSCIHDDDVKEIMDKVQKADILVFATPIYYYEMAGQLKTLLDRLNPLYPKENHFRKVYMIATAADDGEGTFEKAYNGLRGWTDCFGQCELCGIVTGGGCDAAGCVKDNTEAMDRAYELGKTL